MASLKTTFYTVLALLIIGGLTAAGVFGWQQYQAYTARKAIAQARALLSDGQPLEADQILLQPRYETDAEAIALRLEALEAAQDPTALGRLAQRVLDPQKPLAQPGTEAWARAQLAIGEAAVQAKDAAAARAAFEAILAHPGGYGADRAQFGLAVLKLTNPDEFTEGEQALEHLITRLPEDDPLRPRVEHLLGDVHIMRLTDRQPHGDDELYVIARGDTIDGMARRFKVSKDLLMRVNGISDPRTLTIGRRIKIPNLDFSIVVNKSDNTLTLLNHGKFFKKYRVRTGEADYMTPSGDFTIGTKVENPRWTNPKTRQAYEPGDPGNELGVRWMGFQQNPSVGIHEAVDPTTVGTYGSNGCVGLAQSDVLELYDLVRVGTPVKIIGQRAPSTSFALSPGALGAPAIPAVSTPNP